MIIGCYSRDFQYYIDYNGENSWGKRYMAQRCLPRLDASGKGPLRMPGVCLEAKSTQEIYKLYLGLSEKPKVKIYDQINCNISSVPSFSRP